MQKLKDFSWGILGIIIAISGVVLFAFILRFGIGVIEKIIPVIQLLYNITLWINILILLPLSFIKKTRMFSLFAFYVSSYIFGIELWMLSLLITYFNWGWIWVFVGIFLFGVGVVPIAVLGSLFIGDLGTLFGLLFMVALTYGARAYALYIANKIDKEHFHNASLLKS